jgi:hypothetical protein
MGFIAIYWKLKATCTLTETLSVPSMMGVDAANPLSIDASA